jgi:glycosyltransferase involved in cell wall biosynthesis
MNTPLISIVLPVHNAASYLRECLDSIVQQSFTNWELIAVDDGSEDNSIAILNSVSDPRIRIFRNESNRGASFTRNFAISKARGEYIALQDSDDYMDHQRLFRQIHFLTSNSEIDLVGTFMTLISDDGRIIAIQKSLGEMFSVDDLLFTSNAPAHATLLGHKIWFERNPYPEHIRRAEDRYLLVNALYNDDFNYALIPEPLYFYRFASATNKKKLALAYQTERQHLIVFLDQRWKRIMFFTYSFLKTSINMVPGLRKSIFRIMRRH